MPKRVTLFILACLVSASFLSVASSNMIESTNFSPEPQTTEKMDNLVTEIMIKDSIPGIAATVVHEKEIVYTRGFGVTSAGNSCKVSKDTVFELASVSKSFTALGVLLLRDKGYIKLDRPLVEYLPDFSLANPGTSAEITIYQLLTHTSGIPGAMAEPQGYYNGPDAMQQMVNELSNLRLSNSPGEAFEYSNLNYFLLGALIEEVSTLPFEEYMAKHVFEPLGLYRTTLKPSQAEAWGKAYGHQSVFGQTVKRSMPIYRSAAPAGWVMSSAEDMGRWLSLFINEGQLDGKQIVEQDTIRELLSPAVSFEKDGYPAEYAMGWIILTDNNGTKRLWHAGNTPSYLADILILPDYKTGVAVMANSQTGTSGHNIAPGLAGIYLDTEIEIIQSSWWAYWKRADTFSFVGLALAAGLLVGWAIFVFHLIRKLRLGYYCFVYPKAEVKRPPLWQMCASAIPFVLLCLFLGSSYIILNSIYGYNIFTVLGQSLLVIPPSTWATAISIISLASIWSITLLMAAFTVRRPIQKE